MRGTERTLAALTLLVMGLVTACATEQPGGTPADAGCTGALCTAVDAGNRIPPPDGGTSAPGAGAAAPVRADDLPCEVKSVLNARCGACHNPAGGIGGSALASRADFLAASALEPEKTVARAASERLHSTASGSMMPPAGSPRLTSDELALLDAWLSSGLSVRSGVCGADDAGTTPGVDAGGSNAVECYKLLAHDVIDRKAKYKVGAVTDSYINMGFAAPWQGKRYAVSIKPVVDNAKVLHHWLLYDEPAADGSVLPATGAHPAGQLLSGWAPGGEGIDLTGHPDDVGYEMPPLFNVEFHYNSKDAAAEDASGVEICLMNHTPKNIVGLSWVGSDNLVVPSDHWVGQCHPINSEPVHIIALFPHMHVSGRRMVGTLHRKDGTKEVFHDDLFDFDYQHNYPVDVVVNPGDWIQTDCYYEGLQLWGESTNSEMCYLFSYAYPKGALRDVGVWGTVAHGGMTCVN
jgi:mono/diheme cytochrome c family protein